MERWRREPEWNDMSKEDSRKYTKEIGKEKLEERTRVQDSVIDTESVVPLVNLLCARNSSVCPRSFSASSKHRFQSDSRAEAKPYVLATEVATRGTSTAMVGESSSGQNWGCQYRLGKQHHWEDQSEEGNKESQYRLESSGWLERVQQRQPVWSSKQQDNDQAEDEHSQARQHEDCCAQAQGSEDWHGQPRQHVAQKEVRNLLEIMASEPLFDTAERTTPLIRGLLGRQLRMAFRSHESSSRRSRHVCEQRRRSLDGRSCRTKSPKRK